MSPNDPRHGSSAGYCAGCRDTCCRTAIADYARNLRTRIYLAGGPMRVDALGTKRRIRALMALGWTSLQIDSAIERERTYTAGVLCGPDRVLLSTAQLYAAVYDRMSMRLPDDEPDARRQVITRTKNASKRKGWLPPLAWVDIDDPDERPDLTIHDTEPDHVTVDRILAGEYQLPANRAERWLVICRWPGSDNDLERLTGWNVARMRRHNRPPLEEPA